MVTKKIAKIIEDEFVKQQLIAAELDKLRQGLRDSDKEKQLLANQLLLAKDEIRRLQRKLDVLEQRPRRL